jgi:hypothetical protein
MKTAILHAVAALALLVSAHAEPFKVAAVEFNPEFFEFEKNIPRIVSIVE